MTRRPLVSVIVPAYNVETYVAACIKSIARQTYENLEIIIINDGSSDNTGAILDHIALQDERVRVYHEKNGGVSNARNIGLSHAKGEYVMFVDSDDWIDETTVDILMQVAKDTGVEMVTCGRRRVFEGGKYQEVPSGYQTANTVLRKPNIIIELIKELFHSGGGVVCRLISANHAKAVGFRKDMRLSEDQEWLFKLMASIKSSIYIADILYNVRIRPGSATTVNKKTDSDDLEVVNRQIIAWAEENNMTNDRAVSNTLFFRSRLQYASAIRSFSDKRTLNLLKEKMAHAYSNSKQLPVLEKVKYYTYLTPPVINRLIRMTYQTVRSKGSR